MGKAEGLASMKTCLYGAGAAALFLVLISSSYCLGAERGQQEDVSARGLNRKVWQRVTAVTNQAGQVTAATNRTVPLQAGAHYRDSNGALVEARPEFELLDNQYVARRTRQRVAIAPNLKARTPLTVAHPDGLLSIRPMGLSFLDTASGANVIFAEVKECAPVLIANNCALFRDCFIQVRADLRVTITAGAIEADVIFRDFPEVTPESYGLASASTRLEVLTAFDTAIQPRLTTRLLKREANPQRRAQMFMPDVADTTISLGSMVIGAGKAFGVYATNQAGSNQVMSLRRIPAGARTLPVAKAWERHPDTELLVESLDYLAAIGQLEAALGRTNTAPRIPLNLTNAVSRPTAGVRQRRLPAFSPLPESLPEPVLTARLDTSKPLDEPGFVVDWLLSETVTDFTFESYNPNDPQNTVYEISGYVPLEGVTTIRPNAVIRFQPWAMLHLEGDSQLQCLATPEAPALLTSIDDTSYAVGGADNSSGTYADVALEFWYPTQPPTLANLKIRHAWIGIYYENLCDGQHGFTLSNAEITGGEYGLAPVVDVFSLQNVQLTGLETAFWSDYVQFAGNLNTVVVNAQNLSYGWSVGSSLHAQSCLLTYADQGPVSLVIEPDGDNLPESWENRWFNGPIYGDADDPDADGLDNLGEYQRGTDPTSPDSDGDWEPDGEDADPLIPWYRQEQVWMDDTLPGDPTTFQWWDPNPWDWRTQDPLPVSGTQYHASGYWSTLHMHYFTNLTSAMTIDPGDVLVTYVYIPPGQEPVEIVLEWKTVEATEDLSWSHRAYWGTEMYHWSPMTQMSATIPPSGRWVRLEVPAALVNLEGKEVKGLAFGLYGGKAYWDRSGKYHPDSDNDGMLDQWEAEYFPTLAGQDSTTDFDQDGLTDLQEFQRGTNPVSQDSDADNLPDNVDPLPLVKDHLLDVAWVDDNLPAGQQSFANNDAWSWVASPASPAPVSGDTYHSSSSVVGLHQHAFHYATETLTIAADEMLYAFVYIPFGKEPKMIMLQWCTVEGWWEHRAYWGANLSPWGIDGTESLRRMGDVPAPGRWVRLEVPAQLVGLTGKTVHGMAFTLWDGMAHWDRGGKCLPDYNVDGLGDAWQGIWFGGMDLPVAAPTADPDEDGLDNLAEFQQGTNPLVPNQATEDTTPPAITMENQLVFEVHKPYIQILGYAEEPLRSIRYDIVGPQAVQTDQQGFVTRQELVSSEFPPTSFEVGRNYFQCFDVELAEGLNVISLQFKDETGNVTVKNLQVTLNLAGDAMAPVIEWTWPQNGDTLSGNEFTMYGSIDDETAAVTLSANGEPLADGIVERDGKFWIENVSLAAGDNTFTLIVTDAAGNVTSRDIALSKSPVDLQVFSPEPGALIRPATTIAGTIDASGYDITVNDVPATVNPDGTWSAENVPVPDAGTVTFTAKAFPPDPLDPVVLKSLVLEKPPFIYIDERRETWEHRFLDFDQNEHIDRKDSEGGDFRSIYAYESSTFTGDFTVTAVEQTANWGTQEIHFSDGSIWAEPYERPPTGQMPVYRGRLSAVTDPSNPNPNDIEHRQEGFGAARLFTGAKAPIGAKSLFVLTGSVTAYSEPPYFGGRIGTPIAPELVQVGALGSLGSDEVRYAALPHNAHVDVTLRAPVPSYEYRIELFNTHMLLLSANNRVLNNHNPEFCLGEKVVFASELSPSLPCTILSPRWKLPPKQINRWWKAPESSTNYWFDDQMLHNPSTTCWFTSGKGGNVLFSQTMRFSNGQDVTLAGIGKMRTFSPQVVISHFGANFRGEYGLFPTIFAAFSRAARGLFRFREPSTSAAPPSQLLRAAFGGAPSA